MPPRLDDHKRTLQFLFTVQCQDSFHFRMHGILGRGGYAEVDDSCPAALGKDEPAEITVASDENLRLRLSDAKQFCVIGLRQAELCCRDHIMAQGL